MSAETLRKAAALMRERAEAATPGPWEHDPVVAYLYVEQQAGAYADVAVDTDGRREDSVHIASWHPAVALAVADWLDSLGTLAETLGVQEMSMASQGNYAHALTVATAYLGEQVQP